MFNHPAHVRFVPSGQVGASRCGAPQVPLGGDLPSTSLRPSTPPARQPRPRLPQHRKKSQGGGGCWGVCGGKSWGLTLEGRLDLSAFSRRMSDHSHITMISGRASLTMLDLGQSPIENKRSFCLCFCSILRDACGGQAAQKNNR